MKCNVGGTDRLLRLVLGAFLIVLNLFGVLSGTLAFIAWVVAAIAVITGVVRFCPANSLLGLNTCESQD